MDRITRVHFGMVLVAILAKVSSIPEALGFWFFSLLVAIVLVKFTGDDDS